MAFSPASSEPGPGLQGSEAASGPPPNAVYSVVGKRKDRKEKEKGGEEKEAGPGHARPASATTGASAAGLEEEMYGGADPGLTGVDI